MNLFVLLFFFGVASLQADNQIPLQEILNRKDFSNYSKKEKYNDRIEVLRKALEKKSKALHPLIDKQDLAPADRALLEIRTIISVAAGISAEESNEKELRHKEVKRMEIVLRKLSEDLDDLKMEFPYENRTPFESTRDEAEEFRDRLLKQLFGEAIGGQNPSGFNFLPPGSGEPAASGSQGLWDIDKFTEEEFTKIQLAQELVKRTEVFLEIAKSRLDEIDRRVEGIEWEEEEPNPLEFFLYEDLLHGYARAINGVMINIDDKVELRRTPDKDIRKSLKKLMEGIEEFAPRLEKLESLVRKEKDQDLLFKYRDAMKKTEQAYQGAKFGLGSVPSDE